jgi:Lipopolysaccharide kinase (Kdo/WaaP) family
VIPCGSGKRGNSEKSIPGPIILEDLKPSYVKLVGCQAVLLPDFTLQKRGSASMWVDRKFADPAFIDSLADADRWFDDPRCRIIKDEKKITVGRLTVKIGNEEHALYVKRFNAFSVRYRLVSLFAISRAFKSLRGAAILRDAKIPTVRPVAAVENRAWGTLSKSFFISEEIAEGQTTDAYWVRELRPLRGRAGTERRRGFLRGLAELFRSLHAQQIYHNDLKDANILAVTNGSDSPLRFFLLDLEGVKRYSRLSKKRRLKNLVQLHRTLGRYLRRHEKLFFLKTYLGSESRDHSSKRRLISKILRQTRRVEVIKARQAAEARASMN